MGGRGGQRMRGSAFNARAGRVTPRIRLAASQVTGRISGS